MLSLMVRRGAHEHDVDGMYVSVSEKRCLILCMGQGVSGVPSSGVCRIREMVFLHGKGSNLIW